MPIGSVSRTAVRGARTAAWEPTGGETAAGGWPSRRGEPGPGGLVCPAGFGLFDDLARVARPRETCRLQRAGDPPARREQRLEGGLARVAGGGEGGQQLLAGQPLLLQGQLERAAGELTGGFGGRRPGDAGRDYRLPDAVAPWPGPCAGGLPGRKRELRPGAVTTMVAAPVPATRAGHRRPRKVRRLHPTRACAGQGRETVKSRPRGARLYTARLRPALPGAGACPPASRAKRRRRRSASREPAERAHWLAHPPGTWVQVSRCW